jgi:hypothetical protein
MPRLSVWMVRTALLYLGAGFTFGALILWNKGFPTTPEVWRLLYPHVEFVLLGWTAQLGMGVAFWIMPRFPNAPRFGRTHLAWLAYALLNGGVLLAAAGLWLPMALMTLVGHGLEALAVGCFALYLWPRVRPLVIAANARQSEELLS